MVRKRPLSFFNRKGITVTQIKKLSAGQEVFFPRGNDLPNSIVQGRFKSHECGGAAVLLEQGVTLHPLPGLEPAQTDECCFAIGEQTRFYDNLDEALADAQVRLRQVVASAQELLGETDAADRDH